MKKSRKNQSLSLLFCVYFYLSSGTFAFAYDYELGINVDENAEYSYKTVGSPIISKYIDKSGIDIANKTVALAGANNALDIKDTDSWILYGGISKLRNDVSGYKLSLKNIIGKDITLYGGRAFNGFNATNNSVYVDEGSLVCDAYGGRAARGNASENQVYINKIGENKSVIGFKNIYGGKSTNGGSSNSNIAEITKGNATGNIYGGYASSEANANSNSVTLIDSAANDVFGGYLEGPKNGGWSDSASLNNANNNIVTIEGTTAKNVYGGVGRTASGNSVSVTDSTVKDVYGGYSGKIGESNPAGSAANNQVMLENSTADNVYAGYGKIVSENSVSLNGAIINNNLYGANATTTKFDSNKLILLSTGNEIGGNLSHFDIIKFKFDWKKDETVLKLNSFSNMGNILDVSDISNANEFGKMILISSDNSLDFSDFKIKYNDNINELNANIFSENKVKNFTKYEKDGVKISYNFQGKIFQENNNLSYQVSGKVKDVIFNDVLWKNNDAPLIVADENLSFEDSSVNTSNINFINIDALYKNDTMILIKNFGEKAKKITGNVYKINTTLEGRGRAKISDKNLIFVVETEAKNPKTAEDNFDDNENDNNAPGEEDKTIKYSPKNDIKDNDGDKDDAKNDDNSKNNGKDNNNDNDKTGDSVTDNDDNNNDENGGNETSENTSDNASDKNSGNNSNHTEPSDSSQTPTLKAQEQTHNTVMGMEASIAALSSANEFMQTAMDGISTGAKGSSDGVATYAGMGGAVSETKTGSSVCAYIWSAILALGQERKLKSGTLAYGGFFEYGRACYTLEPNNGTNGVSKYTGGGAFVKWKTLRDIYFEGSFRAGKLRDSATAIVKDAMGNSYGYDVSSTYTGAHFGIGKIYKYADNRELDIYGKFFYTRRGGVSYNAGGFYELDALTSKVLKIGGRYGKNEVGWNSYFGLAYAYEFDSAARGKADSYEIREASSAGGTFYVEMGLGLKPSQTSKWKSDIKIKAHAGKSKGFGGQVFVAYLF